jgi:hypothetical protein
LGVLEIIVLAMILVGALGRPGWLAIASGALQPLIALTKVMQRSLRS